MGTHPIFESDFDCLTDWAPTHFWIWLYLAVLVLRPLKKNVNQVMNSPKLLQMLVNNLFLTSTKSVWPMETSIPLLSEHNSKRLCKTMPPSSELVKSLKKVVKSHKKFMMI